MNFCSDEFFSFAHVFVYVLDLFDMQNTLLLRAIPGLNELGKALLGITLSCLMILFDHAKYC